MSQLFVFCLVVAHFIAPGLWIVGRQWYRRAHEEVGESPEERALAEERSRSLLRELLNEREYQQLMQRGYLEVASPSRAARVYRIPCFAGRVRVYEDGRPLVELCVRPVAALPTNDVIVLHKLMIQANEQGYLAQANRIQLTLPPQFYE